MYVPRRVTEINTNNCTLEELQVSKACARTQEDFIRLDTIELLLRGYSRREVEKIKNMSARTLRDWVAKFNRLGIDGVITKARPGRARTLEREYFQEVAQQQFSSACFSVVQLHGYLSMQLKKELSYCTCWRYTREAGFSLIVPRKVHPNADPELQRRFVEDFNTRLKSEPLRVFFCDEAGVEGDPRPCRQWYQKGTKPRVKNDGVHLRQSVIGSVSPVDGEFFSLVVPYTDTQVFQLFLDTFSERIKNERVYLVLDNASWHHAAGLNWHNFIPLFLPPYSPELNPIERLWKVLKDRYFKNWYSRDEDTLTERLCHALLQFQSQPENVKSICNIHYLQ
jgi:transposase